ncbi:uncharacterized protein LOC107844428 [Capsicum annuum]|uniref:uncharacterized protein LOC107844428 n=1 Tax=Capsicum annuum TaxID=4072 RepID=UPI001FB054CB|nr:uncharacterized protein LOC107844428 [Capsicum annuum]
MAEFIPEDVWESYQRLWADPKYVDKSKINAQNHRDSKEVTAGTHTKGSISIGKCRKRLISSKFLFSCVNMCMCASIYFGAGGGFLLQIKCAAEMGRDPTPSELHLHVHTHGHDGKSFVDKRCRIIHERFEEILREKTLSEYVIDQIKAYYQVAGGEKERKVFGLGSEAQGYYEQTLCVSCGKTSSSASHESVPAADLELDAFVTQLIPALKNQFIPIVIEEVQKLVSSPSVVTPPTTTLDDLDSLDEDCNDLDQL